MGEVEFNNEDEYKVKIVDGGEYKEPGGAIRKPSQEEIDAYKIHRIIVMIIFGLVVIILLLLVIILIATTEGCKMSEEKSLPWYKSGVIYNIYPRSFKDSNSDGTGDFKGIVEKLDYLKGLGVNILYLSSVFKIDKTVDYGYSVIDLKKTNLDYGSIEEFQNLVDSAHKKDMKVIIEFIPCDTSIYHKWFKESKEGQAKNDWYIWTDDNSTARSGIWEKDNTTGKERYYLRQKNYPGKAYLNWNSNAVKNEMESILGFWLDKKVDGFRVVSVQRLFGDSPTPDDWTKIHTIVQKWQNYTTKKNADSILIGSSHPANLDLYGTKSLPELDIVVNFKLVPESASGFYTAANFKTIITEYIKKLSKGNWPSWALTSWVHGRVGSNVDSKLARSLEALLLMLPGTPIVFYGDEIGMQNVNNSGNLAEDINKAPMQWENSTNAGFTSAASTWFGDVGDYKYTNAKDDQLGMKKMFTDAVKRRMENVSALLDGPLSNFTVITEGDVLAYTFVDKVPRFAVAINFGNTENTINLNTKLGVKSATLNYYTTDAKPGVISLNAVKVPAQALYLFNVTQRMT